MLLDDRHVLRLVPLAHAPERPHPGPQALHRVAVHLAHPVAVRVDRPRPLGPEWSTDRCTRPCRPSTRLYPSHPSVFTAVPARHAPSMTSSNSLPPAVSRTSIRGVPMRYR